MKKDHTTGAIQYLYELCGMEWVVKDLRDRNRGCCPFRQARGGPQCQEKDTERTVLKYVDNMVTDW